MMADNRTMAEMLQAPTEGYEDAIVVPAITADNFELTHSLLTLVQINIFLDIHGGPASCSQQPHSTISLPRSLLMLEVPFIRECIKAFETLKLKLTQAPILVAPDWDLPFEIMCDASDFAVGAVLGQRKTKHFQLSTLCSKTNDRDQGTLTTTEKNYLTLLILSPRLLRLDSVLQEFDVVIRDKKGAENLAADHLSRLENPYQSELEKKEITETFPLETLGMVTFRGDDNAPWFADFANYQAGNFVKGMSFSQKIKVFQSLSSIYYWGRPLSCLRYVRIKVILSGVVHGKEALDILEACHIGSHRGDIPCVQNLTVQKKSLMSVSSGLQFTKMPTSWLKTATRASVKEKFSHDVPDFEASRAHGFCPPITRASHPQLHLGIQYPNLID
ncbi:reverse transcriptase domain-containing protein [Tanacetum coccineum]